MLSQSSILNTHIFVLENDEDQRSAYCIISFLSSKSGGSLVAVARRHKCFSCNEPGLSSYVWPRYGVRFRLSEHYRNRWKEISIKEVMRLVQIAWLKKLHTELLHENFNRNGALPNLEVIHFWGWSRSRNFRKDFFNIAKWGKIVLSASYLHKHVPTYTF